jgi:hypothetical protein
LKAGTKVSIKLNRLGGTYKTSPFYEESTSKLPMQIDIGKDQLHNALELLNQGMTLKDDFDESKLK